MIQRIRIIESINGQGGWRFTESMRREPCANFVYQQVFRAIGCTLLNDSIDEVKCTKADKVSGLDLLLGIDVILTFNNRMQSTIQEKFLFVDRQTVTVEYYQNPRIEDEGDWFKLKAQYYFVGYDRTKFEFFQDWILLDWPQVQRETIRGNINWQLRDNRRDNARANFKFTEFSGIPLSCIVAGYFGKQWYLNCNKVENPIFDIKNFLGRQLWKVVK